MAGTSNDRVIIYDSTLRDGTQAPNISLSLEDKLQIAHRLDEFGIDVIEGGYPLSNPKDVAFFQEIAKAKLKHAKIAAFGMTRKKGIDVADDACITALVESKAEIITIVGKSDDFHIRKVLSTTAAENQRMIADSIGYCKKKRRQVILDAEHFYDGYKRNAEVAMGALQAALDGGASTLCLCDTNGGSLPNEVYEITLEVVKKFGGDAIIGFHGHNDGQLAVANSLAAIQAGARHVQGTINGIGERCGNADLTSIIPNLMLKMKLQALPSADHLLKLTELSRYVYEMANVNLVENQPFVGPSAFAHKGGMHVHAILKDTHSYEHIAPEQVGNTRKVLISELSGASNMIAKSALMTRLDDKTLVRKVLDQVQNLENEGYQFEAAEGSFHLLVLKTIGKYQPVFDLDHYQATVYKRHGRSAGTEGIVKILVQGQEVHTVAEGDGPVNALDAALRKALLPYYPEINEIKLVDYKVRIVNPKAGTAARTRVIVESSDRNEHWGTIGVSDNIIDASWAALVDAIEYKIHKGKGLED